MSWSLLRLKHTFVTYFKFNKDLLYNEKRDTFSWHKKTWHDEQTENNVWRPYKNLIHGLITPTTTKGFTILFLTIFLTIVLVGHLNSLNSVLRKKCVYYSLWYNQCTSMCKHFCCCVRWLVRIKCPALLPRLLL